MAFYFDPPEYDRLSKTATIRVRLRNTTGEMIYGPIAVEIKSLRSSIRRSPTDVLNSTNEKSGTGAIFNYGTAPGQRGALPPHCRREATPWRVRFPTFGSALRVDAEITGFLAK
jgi:hypothetical protein